MALSKPDEDLAAHLATELTLTAGVDVFFGPRQPADSDIASLATFITPITGSPPEPLKSSGGKDLRRPTLQMLTRGDADKYQAALQRARDVAEATQHAAIAGYIGVNVLGPVRYLNQDDRGQHEFVQDVEFIVEE